MRRGKRILGDTPVGARKCCFREASPECPRILLGALVALALAGGVALARAAEVSLPVQSAAPGASVAVPLAFKSQGGSISGLQFNLQYDSRAMHVAATLGEAARKSGKRLYGGYLAADKQQFILIGLNRDAIPDGALLNLLVNVSANAASGSYALRFSGVTATDPAGRAVATSGVDGSVKVEGSAGQGARIQTAGVLNGASFLSGPVAPGEIVTLIGSGIGPVSIQQPSGAQSSPILGGTSVIVDDAPAPLLYASSNQVNAVIPFTVSGKSSVQMRITRQEQTIAELEIPVSASSPAVFTLDSSGAGPAVALNQDSSMNSPLNPAEKGTYVTLFAAGAGQTDPPSEDGQIAGEAVSRPLLPVSVQIGGVQAEVRSASNAPGLIAGFLQVTCVIPKAAPSGYNVPVVLTVGPSGSQAGVTLALK